MVGQFTKRQWLTLIVISIADFANAVCISLQSPFYPREAEKKGASPTEYGLVFGVFELVVFLISPVYGKNLNKIGPKVLFNGGIFTASTCAIIFGLLDKVDGHYPFIILSFTIRIIGALGNAAFVTASFAIVAREFPENIATTFASLETFFGLGLITGPTVGGVLFEAGGYITPFVVMGSILFLAAVISLVVLPVHNDMDQDVHSPGGFIKLLRIPGVMIAASSIAVTSMSIGYLQATLEPNLRQFNLSPVVLGLVFIINGGVYALSAPAWGWLCDRGVQPKTTILTGCVLIMVAFCLIGPAPFIPSEPLLSLTICGLVIHGLGIAAQLVASFTDALSIATCHGFPNNIGTYGLISGLWTSTFSLGAFIGPSVGGILLDHIGFSNSSIFVIILHLLVGIAAATFITCDRTSKHIKIESNEIIPTPLTDSGKSHSLSSSHHHLLHHSLSIGRPCGMSSLISSHNYSEQACTWARISDSGRYSQNYGSVDNEPHAFERIG